MPLSRPFPLHAGFARVVRAAPVTPRMRRVTLAAPEFADFGIEEPGEIVTLGWPDPGNELVLPELGWRFPPGKREQHWRNYTVRAHRPERAEIDIDFFLHGDLGRASAWAARAEPGDQVGFAGPRTHWEHNGGCDWSLLVADETGLPAALAILETLPADHRAVALLEVAGEHEHQEVSTRSDADLRWLRRGRAAEAVRELGLPWGRGHVWGAGESRTMRAVRDQLRGRPGVEKLQVLGYWSRVR